MLALLYLDGEMHLQWRVVPFALSGPVGSIPDILKFCISLALYIFPRPVLSTRVIACTSALPHGAEVLPVICTAATRAQIIRRAVSFFFCFALENTKY